MDVDFQSAKDKRLYENSKQLTRKYGKLQAELIIKRINELEAAQSLYDIKQLPQARLHPLKGGFKGCFAVDLQYPYRIIIRPLNGENDDLKSITEIRVEKIYHDYH